MKRQPAQKIILLQKLAVARTDKCRPFTALHGSGPYPEPAASQPITPCFHTTSFTLPIHLRLVLPSCVLHNEHFSPRALLFTPISGERHEPNGITLTNCRGHGAGACRSSRRWGWPQPLGIGRSRCGAARAVIAVLTRQILQQRRQTFN